MLRSSPLWLLALAGLGSAGAAEGPPGPSAAAPAPVVRTETAPDGSFSITFPASWRAVATTSGAYAELALFADGPLDISIVVGARPLRPVERGLDRRRLLDRMIELTMIHTTELGNEILQVGRIDPLVEDWPAFAAVATNRDRSRMMTISRTFDAGRAYVVTTLTDNLQGSPELAQSVTRVVESFAVHRPPPPVQPAVGDCW